jgi:hypothetical protein
MQRLLAVIATLTMTYGVNTVHAAEVEGVPQVSNKEEKTRIRMQSCALDRAEARETLVAKDIFVDYSFLPVLLGKELTNLNNGWPRADNDHVIKYMLSAGWAALETQKNYETSITRDLPATTPILRFELMPAGSEFCKNWSKQYEYPLQAFPFIRQLGVSPQQCVAIRELPSPTAQARITVDRTRLFVDPAVSELYTWRLDVRAGVVDNQTQFVEAATATMHLARAAIGRHGSSDLWFACSEASDPATAPQAGTIARSLRSDGSHRLTPRPVVVRTDQGIPNYEAAEDSELSRYRWIKTSERHFGKSAYYSIDAQGMIWTARFVSGFPSWSLQVVQEDRILVTKIPLESRLRYVTHVFASTASNGYAVVMQVDSTKEIRLFEYDHELQLVKAFTLTQEQLDRVLPLTR